MSLKSFYGQTLHEHEWDVAEDIGKQLEPLFDDEDGYLYHWCQPQNDLQIDCLLFTSHVIINFDLKKKASNKKSILRKETPQTIRQNKMLVKLLNATYGMPDLPKDIIEGFECPHAAITIGVLAKVITTIMQEHGSSTYDIFKAIDPYKLQRILIQGAGNKITAPSKSSYKKADKRYIGDVQQGAARDQKQRQEHDQRKKTRPEAVNTEHERIGLILGNLKYLFSSESHKTIWFETIDGVKCQLVSSKFVVYKEFESIQDFAHVLKADPSFDISDLRLQVYNISKHGNFCVTNRIDKTASKKVQTTGASSIQSFEAAYPLGTVFRGVEVVKVVTFGAFVRLPDAPVDALIHISEMSYAYIDSPDCVIKSGDRVDVKLIKIDLKKSTIDLSIKQLKRNPYSIFSEKIQTGTVVKGKVCGIKPYGVFVSLTPELQGFVHYSEMTLDDTKQPAEIAKEGDDVYVAVKDIDPNEERIALSMIDVVNTYELFAAKYLPGSFIKGFVANIDADKEFVRIKTSYNTFSSVAKRNQPNDYMLLVNTRIVGDPVNVKIVDVRFETIKQISVSYENVDQNAVYDEVKLIDEILDACSSRIVEIDLTDNADVEEEQTSAGVASLPIITSDSNALKYSNSIGGLLETEFAIYLGSDEFASSSKDGLLALLAQTVEYKRNHSGTMPLLIPRTSYISLKEAARASAANNENRIDCATAESARAGLELLHSYLDSNPKVSEEKRILKLFDDGQYVEDALDSAERVLLNILIANQGYRRIAVIGDIDNSAQLASLLEAPALFCLKIEKNGKLCNRYSIKTMDKTTQQKPPIKRTTKTTTSGKWPTRIKGSNERIGVREIPILGHTVCSNQFGPVKLVSPLGNPGMEGAVYETNTEYVAKILNSKSLTLWKKAKIEALINKKMDKVGICFPTDVLTNSSGEFVGYLMSRAKGRTLDTSIFSTPARFEKRCPNWDKRKSIKLAQTILDMFLYLHTNKILFGDINGFNIMMESENEAYFIDTDSFQIEGIPLTAITPEWKAPRLHKECIPHPNTKLITLNDEMFAVAMLLFEIFIPGVHPYIRVGGSGMVENLLEGDFSYQLGKKDNGLTPDGPWKNTWFSLPYNLRRHFWNTFNVEGEKYENRYSIENWIWVIGQYEEWLNKQVEELGNNSVLQIFPEKKVSVLKSAVCEKCGEPVAVEKYKSKNILCDSCREIQRTQRLEEKCKREQERAQRELEKTQKHEREKARQHESEKKRKAEQERKNQIRETKTCVTCGKSFNITVGEFEFYSSKGMSLPKRCEEHRGTGQYAPRITTHEKSVVSPQPFVSATPVSTSEKKGLFDGLKNLFDDWLNT